MKEDRTTDGTEGGGACETPLGSLDHPAKSGISWYALKLRSNYEKRARDFLLKRSVEVFLPLYRVVSGRRDRRVTLDRPLFSTYVFVHSGLGRRERVEVLRAPGAVGLVGFDGPMPIPDDVIASVRALVGSGRDPEPFPFLSAGRRVRIAGGPLAGLCGFVVDGIDGRRRVVISVDLLGRSVAVTIDRHELEPERD